MSEYHEEAGKGSGRRQEDIKAIESNWDKIDWSKKKDTSAAEQQTEDKSNQT